MMRNRFFSLKLYMKESGKDQAEMGAHVEYEEGPPFFRITVPLPNRKKDVLISPTAIQLFHKVHDKYGADERIWELICCSPEFLAHIPASFRDQQHTNNMVETIAIDNTSDTARFRFLKMLDEE
jgi:hypothetical protein